MGKCTTKAIQVDLGIATHIQAYSGIFRKYLGILEPCVTLTYSVPWFI